MRNSSVSIFAAAGETAAAIARAIAASLRRSASILLIPVGCSSTGRSRTAPTQSRPMAASRSKGWRERLPDEKFHREIVDAFRVFSPLPLLRLQHANRELPPQCRAQGEEDVMRVRRSAIRMRERCNTSAEDERRPPFEVRYFCAEQCSSRPESSLWRCVTRQQLRIPTGFLTPTTRRCIALGC